MRFLVWLLPFFWSLLRLKALGVFDGGMVGVPGSDFYAYAAGGQLMLDHPRGIPSVITQFHFPEGVDKSSIPQLFSDWLWRVWLRALLVIKTDPIWALWMGMVTSTLAGIWGVWGLLWKRYGHNAPLAVAIGWAVICMSPSAWHRTAGHWYLSWIPILFWCALLWWDFWVAEKKPSLRAMAVSHFLLMAQSIYFAVFMLFLIAIWTIAGARDLIKDHERRKTFVRISLAAAVGYILSTAVSVQSMGGLRALAQAKNETERSTGELIHYSFRLRELLKGGPQSPWNAFAESLWGQAPVGSFGQDGETFPSSFPKLLVVFSIALAIGIVRRHKNKVEPETEDRRALWFGLWGVIGIFVIGSYETHWLRTEIIHKFFPFIRAYSRMVILLTGVAALWMTSLWASRLRKTFSSKRNSGLLAGFAILLVWTDYGSKQTLLELTPTHPCHSYFEIAKHQGLPILWHQTRSTPPTWACARNHYDHYPNTGSPLLTDFWGGPMRSVVLPKTEECQRLQSALELAADTHPIHAVLWWFEGAPSEWEATRECLGLSKREIFYQRSISDSTSADAPKLIMSRWHSR